MNQTYCISSSQPPYESGFTIRAWRASSQVERVSHAGEFLMTMVLKSLDRYGNKRVRQATGIAISLPLADARSVISSDPSES